MLRLVSGAGDFRPRGFFVFCFTEIGIGLNLAVTSLRLGVRDYYMPACQAAFPSFWG